MSVEITFQPDGLTGLVSEGTYLIEAARRMGLRLPIDCKERGECTSCAVVVTAGHALLSSPTKAELKMLSNDRIANNHRLACQAKLERSGEVEVKPITAAESSSNQTDKKPSTAAEENAIKMMKQFDAFVDKSLSAGENLLDRFANRMRLTRERELERKRPPEHRGGKNS